MPFIEKQYRAPIDWYIKDAEDNKLSDALIGLCEVLSDREKIPQEVFDGALNYTCTQLYRKCNIVTADSLVFFLLNHFYLSKPRYIKLKDAFGLLDAIIAIFDTKEVISIANPLSDVINSLTRIRNNVTDIYVKYEHEVKVKNGDLE